MFLSLLGWAVAWEERESHAVMEWGFIDKAERFWLGLLDKGKSCLTQRIMIPLGHKGNFTDCSDDPGGSLPTQDIPWFSIPLYWLLKYISKIRVRKRLLIKEFPPSVCACQLLKSFFPHWILGCSQDQSSDSTGPKIPSAQDAPSDSSLPDVGVAPIWDIS